MKLKTKSLLPLSPFALLGRKTKVDSLLDALDRKLGKLTTLEDLYQREYSLIAEAVQDSGVKSASQETIDALLERIDKREGRMR